MTDQILEFAQGRTVRALVLPYGELGNGVEFAKGTVELPADPASVKLRIGHPVKGGPEPTVIGHGVSFEDTDKGIVGTFEVENNVHGDRLLEDHASGRKTSVSAEVANFATEGVKVIRSTLQHVAAVVIGAFPSAAFFALEETPDAPAEEEQPANDLSQLSADELNALIQQATDELTQRAQTTEDAPASEDTAAGFSVAETESETPAITEQEGTAMAEAVVPNNEEKATDFSANKVFNLISGAQKGDQSAEFALSDIKISGTGALPAAGVLQPTWLGEVWSGVEPTRRFAPLIKNGKIVALDEKGFKLSTGSELVKSWAGNKAELPTGTATTSVVSGDPLVKYGFAADIAQEFYLIESGKVVVDAFVREIFRSYARVTDNYVLQKLYAAGAANTVVGTNYPGGYTPALGKLIDGIDRIDDTDVAPTFAIVAPDVYRELRFTPRDALPEFVNFGAGRQEGSADGVTIIRDKAGVLGVGEVLVGSHEAAHMNELNGASPIQIDAVDVAHGGLDKSVIGMQQWMTEYADGFVLITDPDNG